MEPNPTDAPADSTKAPADAHPAAPVDASLAPRTLSEAPPLAGLAAVAGLLATLVVRVMIPTRSAESSVALWSRIAQIGTFVVNLSAIAAMVATVLGLLPWLRGGPQVTLRRRLLIASFGGMLLPVWLRAVFFAREQMNGALASLGAATACTLSVLLVVSALRGSRPRRESLALVTLVGLSAVCSLTMLTLQSISLIAPFSPVHRVGWVVAEIGEAAYLGVMLCGITLVPRRPWGMRDRIAMVFGIGALVFAGVGYQVAVAVLDRELAIALYYAQHVTWLLDGALWLYAIPIALGIGTAVSAWIGSDPRRSQLGVALLAWIGAGYAPRAPWRFMLLAMSATLVARAIAADTEPTEPTPTPPAVV